MVTTTRTLCVPTAQAAPAEPALKWNKEENKPETQHRVSTGTSRKRGQKGRKQTEGTLSAEERKGSQGDMS